MAWLRAASDLRRNLAAQKSSMLTNMRSRSRKQYSAAGKKKKRARRLHAAREDQVHVCEKPQCRRRPLSGSTPAGNFSADRARRNQNGEEDPELSAGDMTSLVLDCSNCGINLRFVSCCCLRQKCASGVSVEGPRGVDDSVRPFTLLWLVNDLARELQRADREQQIFRLGLDRFAVFLLCLLCTIAGIPASNFSAFLPDSPTLFLVKTCLSVDIRAAFQ